MGAPCWVREESTQEGSNLEALEFEKFVFYFIPVLKMNDRLQGKKAAAAEEEAEAEAEAEEEEEVLHIYYVNSCERYCAFIMLIRVNFCTCILV